MGQDKVHCLGSVPTRQNQTPEQPATKVLDTRHLGHWKRDCVGKIPRHEMVMDQIQQTNEAKRRCRACNQLKPLTTGLGAGDPGQAGRAGRSRGNRCPRQ